MLFYWVSSSSVDLLTIKPQPQYTVAAIKDAPCMIPYWQLPKKKKMLLLVCYLFNKHESFIYIVAAAAVCHAMTSSAGPFFKIEQFRWKKNTFILEGNHCLTIHNMGQGRAARPYPWGATTREYLAFVNQRLMNRIALDWFSNCVRSRFDLSLLFFMFVNPYCFEQDGDSLSVTYKYVWSVFDGIHI